MSEIKPDAGWKDLPTGGIIPEGGTSAKFRTGDWRSQKPVWDAEKCINCLQCWIYCPDSSILVEDGQMKGMDMDHCKGCGICAEVCPPKASAITMKSE